MKMYNIWSYFQAGILLWLFQISCATNVVPSHPKIELYCEQIGIPEQIRVVLLGHTSPVIRCVLIKDNEELNLQASLFHGKKTRPAKLDVLTYNSTWSKSHRYTSRIGQTEWTFPISAQDFFHRVTDFDLPMTQSPTYVHTSLKWFMKVFICHPRVNPCAETTVVIVHQASDHIFTKIWGEWVPNIPLNQYEYLLSSSTSSITTTPVPCQSGSSVMFLSNNSVTYIAATWNSFLPNSTLLYNLTCGQTDLPSCRSVIVYNAVITPFHILLVTQHGLLASINLGCHSTNCKNIHFHHVGKGLGTNAPLWSTGKLSYSSVCNKLSSILPHDTFVLFTFQNGNGDQVIAYSSTPFKTWNVHSMHQADVVAVYDQQTQSIISIDTPANKPSTSHSSLLLSKMQRFSPFTFPNSGKVTSILLMPNHHLFAAIANELWLSTDGGNMYTKYHQFGALNRVLKMTGHKNDNSFLLLMNNGDIWWGKSGFFGLKHLMTIQNPLKGIDIAFDNVGMPILLNSILNSNTPHAQALDVFSKSEVCRYSVRSDMAESLHYLDLSTSFSYSVSAELFHDENIPPTSASMLSVTVGNPQIFSFEFNEHRPSKYMHTITITLTSRYNIQGISSVSFNLRNVRSPCAVTTHNVMIVAACPISKQLKFDYSSLLINGEKLSKQEYVSSNYTSLLQELPRNYRPPSSMAVAIPKSSNIYNVDPETLTSERFLTYSFSVKQKLKDFCMGMMNRSSCHCTSAHKFSSLEKYSDCKEKVYKVMYDHTYKLNLSVHHSSLNINRSNDITQYLVYLEELNGRDDSVYFASDDSNTFCSTYPNAVICQAKVDPTTPPDSESAQLLHFLTSGNSKRVFNASQLQIKFLGMGLFHFRVTLANGFSFCTLQDEFQAYVINPPLPFPTATIIRLTVSFMMGAAMVIIYMRMIFNRRVDDVIMEETNAQTVAASKRRQISFVSEDDIKALRTKLRSSFQA